VVLVVEDIIEVEDHNQADFLEVQEMDKEVEDFLEVQELADSEIQEEMQIEVETEAMIEQVHQDHQVLTFLLQDISKQEM
jgi:hypothetical protein